MVYGSFGCLRDTIASGFWGDIFDRLELQYCEDYRIINVRALIYIHIKL
jgi:hypothetical protein